MLDKKIAQIVSRIELQREYDLQKIILNEIAHLQGSILSVLDKEMKLLFLNDKALEFWKVDTVEEALASDFMLASRMVEQDECFYPSSPNTRDWIAEILKLESHRRVIALDDMSENKIKTFAVDISLAEKSGHTIISFSEITKLEDEKRLYKTRVYRDDLTQIYNRAMLNKQLDIEVSKATKNGLELSMIVIDIDHFKNINDIHGHLVGDDVLVGLSNLIKSQIRANDLFARWGGEEFVLLLPDTDVVGAGILAENLRKIIEEHSFTKNISMTCSFGVAAMQENDGLSLFRKADTALYKAKLEGRNRVSSYTRSK